MQLFAGIFYHFIGGFASGSFYIPYRKIKGWAWESYWIMGGLFSWLIVPYIAASLTVPHFWNIISETSFYVLGWTYLMGVLWGVGGLTFGLTMRYLGLSLGMSVALGFTAAFGALIPPIYADLRGIVNNHTFLAMLHHKSGLLVLCGVIFCLLGIMICGKAGRSKERELSQEQKEQGIKEFNLKKGLIVATISGTLSACFNFGIETGKPMAVMAVQQGANPLFQNNVIFLIILWGGLTTNFIWCLLLNIRNHSFGDYTNKSAPLGANYFFAAAAGTIWYLQFFFYGMGESRLGNGASSWILHMAFIILVSSMWGIAFKEWKGVSKRTFSTVLIGILIIIFSVVLVGYGNSL